MLHTHMYASNKMLEKFFLSFFVFVFLNYFLYFLMQKLIKIEGEKKK